MSSSKRKMTSTKEKLSKINKKHVEVLTTSNFKEMVLESEEPWLVKFFAPWCGHCTTLAPHYEKAAKVLKGVVKVGHVNCDTE